MKAYPEGHTSRLLTEATNANLIEVWGPKGRGLELDRLGPGNYVILAGGTGVFPFIDLIYLMISRPEMLAQMTFYVFLKFKSQEEFYFSKMIKGLA